MFKKRFAIELALLLCISMVLSACSNAIKPTEVENNTPAPVITEQPKQPDTTIDLGATEQPTQAPTQEPTAEPKPPRFLPVEHGDISFSDIEFVYPDVDALIADTDALLENLNDGASRVDSVEAYEALCERYEQMDTMASYAYVRYNLDVTDEDMKNAQEQLSNQLNDVHWRLCDVGMLILQDEQVQKLYSSEYIATLALSDKLNDKSIQQLITKDNKLVTDYKELLTTFTVKKDGQNYTMSDISALGDQELTQLYYSELNKKAGEIFRKLVTIRNDMAKKLGYESFTEYRYAAYDRDFTPQQAQDFASDVKSYIVPLYMALIFDNVEDYLKAFEVSGYSIDTAKERLKSTIDTLVPELSEAWDYMQSHGLYDFSSNANKQPGSFTTIFGTYNAPFLFTSWTGAGKDMSSLIHEFGHYSNYYFNPDIGWNSGASLDLAEVDSQGLQLLSMHNAEHIYGKGNANCMVLSQMLDALFALISGCMEDEFQQWAYANPKATLKQLNEKYLQIATDYNMAFLYGYTGTEWAQIPHTFESPLYYISYASSMLGALQVWQKSLNDMPAAVEGYMQIHARPAYSKFRQTLMDAGFEDPFSQGVVQDIANSIIEYFAK